VAALVAAGCSDDTASTSTTTASSATTSNSTTTTSTSDGSTTTPTTTSGPALELDQSCTSPDGFTIRYPRDWDAVSDCGQFGPAPLEEPEPATDERPGVVSAYVDPVAFGDVSAPGPGEQARALSVVDGFPAVRVTTEATGEGLYPRGTTSVTWMVDLAIGTDDGAGTLFVDAVNPANREDFDRIVTTLDAMVRGIDVGRAPEDDTDGVVARYQGGGAPFTVAAVGAASTPATCFRFVDADGIACVEGISAPDGVALTGLEGAAGGSVTVGIVGPDVFFLDLEAGDRTLTYVPVPYPGRDSRGFAVPLPVERLGSVTARAIDGTVLAEVDGQDVRRPAAG
jgi:hypothetical protein